MDKLWLITDKGDQNVRRLIDGETTGEPPHYSRQSPGNLQYARNGENLVFVTADLLAAWITFRPREGKAKRMDGLDAWECTCFCNRGPVRASLLVREATALTWALWGRPPRWVDYLHQGRRHPLPDPRLLLSPRRLAPRGQREGWQAAATSSAPQRSRTRRALALLRRPRRQVEARPGAAPPVTRRPHQKYC